MFIDAALTSATRCHSTKMPRVSDKRILIQWFLKKNFQPEIQRTAAYPIERLFAKNNLRPLPTESRKH